MIASQLPVSAYWPSSYVNVKDLERFPRFFPRLLIISISLHWFVGTMKCQLSITPYSNWNSDSSSECGASVFRLLHEEFGKVRKDIHGW